MNIVVIVLGVFYGIIMLLTGALMLSQKKLGRFSSALMLLGGVIITFTFINKELGLMTREIILIIGLISVHISAIMNGYKLYGKPLIKHHLIRALISITLLIGNYMIFKI